VKLLNQELEAFTYSVSHDLRAPLRSITGYTQILKEDYSDKLDEEGKRVTQIVINNAKRMGQLIDDLLDFSRLGRKELSHAHVMMDDMVQDIVRELRPQEQDRQIEIKILPLKPSRGDHSMIRQVWVNLISNALKYSRNKAIAEIEIGSTEKNGQLTYYVRDNGAGFDMQYVEKLFGVFQRLHKINEFEGTGVGLALVKTIIKRHGGFVWAEGKVDEGATFYFSLPAEEQVEV
jgi:light-regulated signal transduction histidine kinase (bacteriophytochrome)